MTVRELIEQLQKDYFPDDQVFVRGEEIGFCQRVTMTYKTTAKPHDEYTDVLVDDDYYEKHPTKGKERKIVVIG